MNRSMGRSPSCSKGEVNKGAWSVTEDKILHTYITTHGEGKWREIAERSGLKRCGKSCRLRWLNYLRPGIKRGNITHDEEDLIIRLHKLLGNRWSLIAGRLPGRTDTEIKNYWNSNLSKKVQQYHNKSQENEQPGTAPSGKKSQARPPIRTKATRCTKVVLPPQQQGQVAKDLDGGSLSKLHEDGNSSVCFKDLDMGTLLSLDIQDSNAANLGRNGIPEHGGGVYGDDDDCSAWISLNLPFLLEDKMLENWGISDDLQAIGESGQ